LREHELLIVQIKIAIKPYKTDEFVKSMRSFTRRIRKEKGCLGYIVYRDIEKENNYSVIGSWRTRTAMEKHFKTLNFELIIGAARFFESQKSVLTVAKGKGPRRYDKQTKKEVFYEQK